MKEREMSMWKEVQKENGKDQRSLTRNEIDPLRIDVLDEHRCIEDGHDLILFLLPFSLLSITLLFDFLGRTKILSYSERLNSNSH